MLLVATFLSFQYGQSHHHRASETSARASQPLAIEAPTPTPTPAASASATSTPAPSKTKVADPITLARHTKPLQDLKKGDRVLYEGAVKPGVAVDPTDPRRVVCTWVLWNKNIGSSLIKCGAHTFLVPTGRLTPVEQLDP
jgi:hypothetical protein